MIEGTSAPFGGAFVRTASPWYTPSKASQIHTFHAPKVNDFIINSSLELEQNTIKAPMFP
jgi:hypothetical protein